ncbi:hypothetical protein BOW53_12475 [Solemya pervernicosa gill symbiont]|uniref:Uncharacterized protein n=1 Tax=Solemya pervernicosa gill symbiont TaxID=642797 RepID=A0A1T2L269_9GAMM|nr:hypothetical protein [Solemya pervernicosa gill symbiont]OOZ39195.1 hypothetical protein BOW53_12475 [Solemya pervernicosa gill symbiont]
MKRYTLYALLLILLMGSLLAWLSWSRFDDFRRYHDETAQLSAEGVADEISRLVAEKQRMVQLFAHEHVPQLGEIINNLDDEHLMMLSGHINDYFPNYFAVTLTDEKGKLLIEDFDGLVGDACRHDISTFIRDGSYTLRIHPHIDVYHFDIMAPFESGGKRGALFISR